MLMMKDRIVDKIMRVGGASVILVFSLIMAPIKIPGIMLIKPTINSLFAVVLFAFVSSSSVSFIRPTSWRFPFRYKTDITRVAGRIDALVLFHASSSPIGTE